jgi:glycine cleavage system H protein
MSGNVPADLRYTKDHEWARVAPDSGAISVGITAFAVEQLGDITLVNLDVKVGDKVVAGKAFGTIESVKTLSDLFAPLSGTIVSINDELTKKPELVNEDCYAKGWMVAIQPSDARAIDGLLDAAAYGELLKAAAH